ncbi:MAG: hypothetical protein LJF06_05190 [Gemmatimonadetes bacterium]|nr:hypothetical protein [Gemmatimonadota bacterium]
MSVRPHPLRWMPALLVGICAATAAEVTVALLLYSGPGLVRSFSTVLGVEAAAFGVGLWTAPRPQPDLLDSVRRRWLLCLVAFLAATVFSAFWSVLQVVGGSALGQGLGLALMGGLPLYACGGALGAMASVNAATPSGGGTPTGAPGFLGAALGFGATGVFLPHVLAPASLLLLCIVLLSAGGLAYGSVLDACLRVRVVARRVAATAEVRVEDRHLPSMDGAGRFLVEGQHVRRWMPLGGHGLVPWDVAAFRACPSGDDGPYRVLLVGGGTSGLPRAVAEEHTSSVLVDVAERVPEVLDLAREHMDTEIPGDGPAGTSFHVGNLGDVIEGLHGPYHLVLVDSAAWDAVGGLGAMSRRCRDLLWSRVEPSGALAVGPLAPDESAFTVPERWAWARYRRGVGADLSVLQMPIPAEEVVLVARAAAGSLPVEMDGFVRDDGDTARAEVTKDAEEAG